MTSNVILLHEIEGAFSHPTHLQARLTTHLLHGIVSLVFLRETYMHSKEPHIHAPKSPTYTLKRALHTHSKEPHIYTQKSPTYRESYECCCMASQSPATNQSKGSVLQCVAECCSVLQCVAVCCSVLQCGISITHYKSISISITLYKSHISIGNAKEVFVHMCRTHDNSL